MCGKVQLHFSHAEKNVVSLGQFQVEAVMRSPAVGQSAEWRHNINIITFMTETRHISSVSGGERVPG